MDASARGVLLNRQNISQCHQHYSFDNNVLKQAKAPTLIDDSKQACRSYSFENDIHRQNTNDDLKQACRSDGEGPTLPGQP